MKTQSDVDHLSTCVQVTAGLKTRSTVRSTGACCRRTLPKSALGQRKGAFHR
ncbi:hypothetical protein DPMN_017630 [Dreissena polymorpha]|uniref:Uncharacterized protein n=1 Tax=Dreissena polymorpha TaxID=45954 RepID=A0A9D4NF70_DREPO|nr:hypothetical protein DPMN_017630 [Dreissena polymorpha]